MADDGSKSCVSSNKSNVSEKVATQSFLQRTWTDLKGTNFSLKLIPFFLYGALACVAPYLALYLRQLGIDAFRIGVLFTIRPILGVICTPCWGFLADRFKIWRFVFLSSIIGTMLFGALVILIKPANELPCDIAISNLASSLGVSPRSNYSTGGNQSMEEYEAYLDELKEEMIMDERQDNKTWVYDEDSLLVLFFEFIFVIIFYEVFFAANLSFLDVSILCELKTNPKFYSKFRSFGSLGWVVGSLLSAAVLQHFRKVVVNCGIDIVATDYKVAFVLMACFYLCSLPVACTLKYEHIKNSNEYQVKNFLVLLMSPAHISVYVIGVFVGVCNGFVWYFLNYHLENLGATHLLMGAALTIGALSEMIWGLFFQVRALERFGHINLITIALFLYCIRFLAYSLLRNPIWILPVEIIQGASYFAVWNTMVSYTMHSFPPQFIATSISFLNATFQNLGIGIGTFLSGFLIDKFNSTITCYIYCGASCCFLIIFIIARRNFNDIQPEIESMNLITKEVEEKEKLRKNVQNTSVRASTPPNPDLTSTKIQTPVPTQKSYNSIDNTNNE